MFFHKLYEFTAELTKRNPAFNRLGVFLQFTFAFRLVEFEPVLVHRASLLIEPEILGEIRT